MKKVKQNWGYVQWWNYALEALIRAASNQIIHKEAQKDSKFMFQNDFAILLPSFEENSLESFT